MLSATTSEWRLMTGRTMDSATFRHVLGHYPTGVGAITSIGDKGPVAMVVGSFTSVSLDPPLVAFLPARSSTSLPKIGATDRFCVNGLSNNQQALCPMVSSSLGD